jgi:hypothetical protein
LVALVPAAVAAVAQFSAPAVSLTTTGKSVTADVTVPALVGSAPASLVFTSSYTVSYLDSSGATVEAGTYTSSVHVASVTEGLMTVAFPLDADVAALEALSPTVALSLTVFLSQAAAFPADGTSLVRVQPSLAVTSSLSFTFASAPSAPWDFSPAILPQVASFAGSIGSETAYATVLATAAQLAGGCASSSITAAAVASESYIWAEDVIADVTTRIGPYCAVVPILEPDLTAGVDSVAYLFLSGSQLELDIRSFLLDPVSALEGASWPALAVWQVRAGTADVVAELGDEDGWIDVPDLSRVPVSVPTVTVPSPFAIQLRAAAAVGIGKSASLPLSVGLVSASGPVLIATPATPSLGVSLKVTEVTETVDSTPTTLMEVAEFIENSVLALASVASASVVIDAPETGTVFLWNPFAAGCAVASASTSVTGLVDRDCLPVSQSAAQQLCVESLGAKGTTRFANLVGDFDGVVTDVSTTSRLVRAAAPIAVGSSAIALSDGVDATGAVTWIVPSAPLDSDAVSTASAVMLCAVALVANDAVASSTFVAESLFFPSAPFALYELPDEDTCPDSSAGLTLLLIAAISCPILLFLTHLLYVALTSLHIVLADSRLHPALTETHFAGTIRIPVINRAASRRRAARRQLAAAHRRINKARNVPRCVLCGKGLDVPLGTSPNAMPSHDTAVFLSLTPWAEDGRPVLTPDERQTEQLLLDNPTLASSDAGRSLKRTRGVASVNDTIRAAISVASSPLLDGDPNGAVPGPPAAVCRGCAVILAQSSFLLAGEALPSQKRAKSLLRRTKTAAAVLPDDGGVFESSVGLVNSFDKSAQSRARKRAMRSNVSEETVRDETTRAILRRRERRDRGDGAVYFADGDRVILQRGPAAGFSWVSSYAWLRRVGANVAEGGLAAGETVNGWSVTTPASKQGGKFLGYRSFDWIDTFRANATAEASRSRADSPSGTPRVSTAATVGIPASLSFFASPTLQPNAHNSPRQVNGLLSPSTQDRAADTLLS